MNHGPGSRMARVNASSSVSKSRTVTARWMPQERATSARSVPVPVWLVWPPVCPQASLSHTSTTRLDGFSRPMVAMAPRFISREPSPSSAITLPSVDRAIPRAMDEHSPMLP